MPSLEELLMLFDGVNTMINIELKGPLDPAVKPLYDYAMACKIVHDLVVKYDASEKVMFSSFCHEIVENLLLCRGEQRYIIHSLKNRGYMPETDYQVVYGVSGVNIAERYLSNDLVSQTHE